jgi:hypothetical protein
MEKENTTFPFILYDICAPVIEPLILLIRE